MDFETWAMQRHGITLEELRDVAEVNKAPSVCSVLEKWARDQSEQSRIRAVTSDGNVAVEALGRWKALQEFADSIRVRVGDFQLLLQEYMNIGTESKDNSVDFGIL